MARKKIDGFFSVINVLPGRKSISPKRNLKRAKGIIHQMHPLVLSLFQERMDPSVIASLRT